MLKARAENASHVPFRDSKLTRLLQPVLSGATLLIFLVCISAEAKNFSETLGTLNFANRVKQIVCVPKAHCVDDLPTICSLQQAPARHAATRAAPLLPPE